MAELIKVSGERSMLDDTSLGSLQKAVGGYIQIVSLPNGQLLVMDEEGKLKGKQVNPVASTIMGNIFDVVVGDAVLCDNDEIK